MCDLYNVGLHSLLNDFASLLIISFTQKTFSTFKKKEVYLVYKLHTTRGILESKERFTIKKYLLIIGKKKNMQVLSHTFTYFST